MKKMIVISLSLILILTSAVGFAAIDIYKERDKVNYTELTHWGDYSALDRIKVLNYESLNNRVFWQSETSMGKEMETTSKYKFHYTNKYEEHPIYYDGIRTDKSLILQSNRNGDVKFLENIYPKGVSYLRNLWEQVKSGEKKTFYVKLKDVMDFYPFGNASNLPGYSSFEHSLIFGDSEDFSNEYDFIMRFQEEFKIPVLEDETVEYTLSRHEDGSEGGIGIGGDNDKFESLPLYTVNEITENDIFFAFDAHTTKGNLVDLSYLEHGYGIYRMPYTESKGADISKLELFIPLNPENTIYNLTSDGENLILTYEEAKKTYLDVISIEKAEVVQKIKLSDEKVNWIIVEPQDDFMVCDMDFNSISDEWNPKLDKIGVLSKKENGYEIEFIVERFTPEIQRMRMWHSSICYAFDGERLVLAGNVREDYLKPDNEIYQTYNSPDFGISVYDKSGPLFAGKYKSSLTTGFTKENEYEYQVHSFYPGMSVKIE